MASVNDGLGNTTSFAYDPSGNLTTISHPDGSTDTYRFNADSMIAEVKATTANATLYDLSTPRNALGDVTSQSATIPGSQTLTTGYSYDANEELTGTTLGTGPLSQPLSNFTYDPAGNLTAQSLAGQGVQSNTYNADSELTSSSDATTGTSTAYNYNTAGERTSETTTVAGEPLTTSFTWNGAGELTGESGPAGAPTGSFNYNGFGLLASNILGSVSYNMDSAVPDIISDGIHGFVRGPGGLVVEETTIGEEPMYYHHDQLGSIKALTGPNGHQLVSYTYSAYGASTASATGIVNPFGFADSYTDPLTGLIYLTNRWYDPATAQFISVDPEVAATGTPYSYAGDDPINNIDPTGLAWCSFLPAGCGTISNFDTGAVSGVETITPAVHTLATGVAAVASACAVFTADPACGAVAAGAGTIAAGTGLIMYADGQQSGGATANDLFDLGLSAFSGAAEVASAADTAAAEDAQNLAYAYDPGSAGEAYQGDIAGAYSEMAGNQQLISRGFSSGSLGNGLYGMACA
jgi:RHS repeat-associated protein